MPAPESINTHAHRFGLPENGAFATRVLVGPSREVLSERTPPGPRTEPAPERTVTP